MSVSHQKSPVVNIFSDLLPPVVPGLEIKNWNCRFSIFFWRDLLFLAFWWWYKIVRWSRWPIFARIQEYLRSQRRYSQKQSRLPWWPSTKTWILANVWWKVGIRHFAWSEVLIRCLLQFLDWRWPGQFWRSKRLLDGWGEKLTKRMWRCTNPKQMFDVQILKLF